MTVRWLLAIGLVVVSGAMPSTAWAYWSSNGAGTGTVRVATLPAPVVGAVSPQYSDQVEVSWTYPNVPAGMEITGFRVVRIAGGTPTRACGTTPSVPLPATALSCVDTGLADGEADYVVTAVVGTWTTTGTTTSPVTVDADRTAPTIRLSGAQRSNALIDRRGDEALLFFRPADGGSIRIDAELTDEQVGPESATFPAVSAPGWSHTRETVTSGTGSAPTVTYRSTALTFEPGAAAPAPMEITGVDARGNSRTRALTSVLDAAPPAGGALTVNGVAADATGSLSWDTDGAFTVSAITPFVEEESASAAGLADAGLVRESAVLAGGSCGDFGGASDIGVASPVEEAGLPDGCYRYTLSGIDRVGNSAAISTTVRVDTTAPIGGALQANGVDALPAGSTSTSTTGAWNLTRTDYTDPESAMTSSTLTRTSATLVGGGCGTFGSESVLAGTPAQSGLGTGCYRYDLVGLNAAGLTAAVQGTVLVDGVAPVGGAVTVNGTAASGAAPTTDNTTGSVTISGLAAYTDANIGLASSVLTRSFAAMSAGVCGTFDADVNVSGSGSFSVTGLADGCHRFTLRGVDLAGNASSIGIIVRVDTSAPAGGVLTVNTVSADAGGTTSTASAAGWTATWTLFADPHSGVASASVTRAAAPITGGTCGTFAPATNVFTGTTPTTGTSTQSALTTGCYRYVLTTTNAFGTLSTLTTTVRLDTTPPSAGAMTVNAVAASAAGSTSIRGTGSVVITVTASGIDTNSGAVTTLVRTQATVAAGVCGTTYGSALTIPYTVGAALTDSGLTPGCYRYTLRATNGVGTARIVLSTVRIDTTGPVGGALSVNGVAATTAGSTSMATAAGFAITRTEWTDPESTVTSVLTRASATLANGVCGTFGTAATLTGSPAQTGLATNCYRYVLTGTNTLVPPAVTLTTIVMLDTTPPVNGVFTVNGAVASLAGSSSTVLAGANFSVSAFTGYAETQSTLASSNFTRTTGVSTAGACGSFDAATTVTLPSSTQTQNGLPNGCYRYVLTGVNSFGGSASVTSTVRVGP